MKKILIKLINHIKRKIFVYVNETMIIYSLKDFKEQTSPAIIVPANLNNLEDILHFQPLKYIEIFKNFLSIGDKGYFAYLDGKCVHRSWVKMNEQIVCPHWAYHYKLKKNEIYIHYCETAPQARGKNIYPHVLSHIIREHLDKEVLISVNAKNIPSRRGVEKVGFREKERVRIIIISGIRIIKKRHQTLS